MGGVVRAMHGVGLSHFGRTAVLAARLLVLL